MNLKEYLENNPQLNRFSFGEFLKQRRTELGYSVREVAKIVEVTPAYISDIEKGNRHAPLKILNQIISILKIQEEDKLDFIDMAYISHETCAPDIIQYLIVNKEARNSLRKEIYGSENHKQIKNKTKINNNFNPKNLPFGEFVRQRRLELGISLRELAKNIGVSAAYYHEVEIGTKHAAVKYLTELKHYLEIPNEHEKDFEDLAYLDYGYNAQYITDYMLESREARLAIRYLIENKISGDELLEIVENHDKNLKI